MRSHPTCRYRALGRTAVRSYVVYVADDIELSLTPAVLQGLLDSGDYYKGPSGQSPCVCNTVMYSLIAGCQLCQYDVPSALLA